jgi:hypothetical protein
MLENGHPSYSPVRINKARKQEYGLHFYGIDLVEMDSNDDINICLNEDNNDLKEYILKINGINSIIDYTESSFAEGLDSTWVRTISLILKMDPFLDPPYIIAEKIYHNDDTKFPLFSPINNIALLTGNILYAIVMPVHDSSHIIKGNKSFAIIQLFFKNNYSFLTILVIREKHVEFYGIRPQKSFKLSKGTADRIIRELQVIEDPGSRNEGFQSCGFK